MENKEQLEELVKGLKEKGFVIPDFEFEGSYDTPWFSTEIVNKRSGDLGLAIYLGLTFNVGGISTAPLDTLLKERLKLQLNPNVTYQSLYFNDVVGLYPVERWKDLPDRIKKESDLLDEIESHMPEDVGMVSARRNMATREGLSWGEFYGKHIMDGKLRWFDLINERFPYVVTDSNTLGTVGRSEGGCYFVSTDVADKPWKEAVVAYHERHCQEGGHSYASGKETVLASALGKSKEHAKWRESLKIESDK